MTWVTLTRWWTVWCHWAITSIHISMCNPVSVYIVLVELIIPGRVGKLVLHNTCTVEEFGWRLTALINVDSSALLSLHDVLKCRVGGGLILCKKRTSTIHTVVVCNAHTKARGRNGAFVCALYTTMYSTGSRLLKKKTTCRRPNTWKHHADSKSAPVDINKNCYT